MTRARIDELLKWAEARLTYSERGRRNATAAERYADLIECLNKLKKEMRDE